MNDLYWKLQKILDDAVASGEECGCQLTVYRHGQLLCDLHSGWTDDTHTQKVDSHTLFPVFSVGKGVLATLYHILAARGVFSDTDLVAEYWPEYAVAGKENTSVQNILTHRSGLFCFPAGYPLEDWFNWEKACSVLEKMTPEGPVGGKHCYHAHTFGILLGRLIEKAAGEELCHLLQQEILNPLNISTFFYGLPEERFSNLAELVPADSAQLGDMRLQFNRKCILAGKNPSSNGTANAHSLARIYASLLEDGVDGIRLLDEPVLERALILRRSADDPAGNEWDKFGLGYALCGPEAPWNRMFGHGGACGSEGFADRTTGYAVGFTKNKLNRTHPVHPVRDRISDALGIPVRVW